VTLFRVFSSGRQLRVIGFFDVFSMRITLLIRPLFVEGAASVEGQQESNLLVSKALRT
jgi:hypothetical protein